MMHRNVCDAYSDVSLCACKKTFGDRLNKRLDVSLNVHSVIHLHFSSMLLDYVQIFKMAF